MVKHVLHQTWNYKIIYDPFYDSIALQELLANPDQALQPGSELLKNDVKTTVGNIIIDGRRLVVKRYNIAGRWHALKRSLSTSRASICWQAAQCLIAARLATPQPVAMIEKRRGLFKSTAYYIHEFVVGMHAGDYFEAPQKQASWMLVASRIAELVQQLEAYNISHGDLKVTNIIISDQKPWLIDLDDTHRHCFESRCQRAIKKDIQRFMQHWQSNAIINNLFAKVFHVKDA